MVFGGNKAKRCCAGLAMAAICGLPGGALAEPLCVESLCLSPAAPWRRGTVDQEQADGVYQLDLDADGRLATQVLVMRQPKTVRGDAAAYHDRLARFWRDTYGKHVLIEWTELAGIRWHSLRRPASENGMGLFQLSTVVDGRAYGLLVFVPGTVTTLNGPVRDLLEGIRFAAPAPAAQRWVRARTYRFSLSGEVLEAVVAPDAERLGQDGMLTGYGLDYGESSIDWFMEGFAWRTQSGRATRLPWGTRGRLEVEAPAELGPAARWSLRLDLPVGEAGVGARLAVWDLCGPMQALQEALDRLRLGARGPMERLAAARPPDCPAPAAADPGWRLDGRPGMAQTQAGTLPGLPDAPGGGAPSGQGRLLLVEALLEPAPGRDVPGDSLLERARLFFAYEPR